MQIAIVGLAGAGKTTVFNTLTRGHVQTGGYGGMELHVGVVKVPDLPAPKASGPKVPAPKVPASKEKVAAGKARPRRGPVRRGGKKGKGGPPAK